MTMGRYEISPFFTDIPGSKPGIQLGEILEGNILSRVGQLLSRKRVIWLILLSTTQELNAQYSSSERLKIQENFVARQLGALRLPQGVLALKGRLRPAMVMLCIAKIDLFLKHSPSDSTSTDSRNDLEATFQEHVSSIRDECEKQQIPYETLFVSALKNWGIQDVAETIRRAIYVN